MLLIEIISKIYDKLVRGLNFLLKDFKSLTFLVSFIGLGCLSFFWCVSIWDSHLDKVHLMEMEILEKNQSIEIDLLEKKKAIEMEILEKKKAIEIKEIDQAIGDAGYYLFWFIGAFSLAALAYVCYNYDYNAINEQLTKSMDISNFAKIEVMQKQIEVMFPKVLDIENRVFDLHCHMENSKGDISQSEPKCFSSNRSILDDIFEVDSAKNEEVMERYRKNG